MTDLLICIGNVGSYATLGPCLASIVAGAGDAFDYTIAVGFNGFEDRAVIERMRAEFPQVEWIFRPEKLGYTGIYNALMRGADARYILVLDDDTLVPAGALRAMVEFMDGHPDVGLSGCRILNPDGSFQKSFNPFPDIWLELAAIVLPGSLWPGRPHRDLPAWQPVDWMDGTFMLVRRAALDEVGDLDVFYFTFLSEIDWALRMHRAGWLVAYVDTVSITHIGGEHSITTRVRKYASIVRSAVNRFYFYRKHHGAGQQLMLRPAVAAGALVRSAKFAMLWLVAPGRRIEAGPKARAFGRIFLLAFQPRPWVLPDYLQRENDAAASGTAAAIDSAEAATSVTRP